MMASSSAASAVMACVLPSSVVRVCESGSSGCVGGSRVRSAPSVVRFSGEICCSVRTLSAQCSLQEQERPQQVGSDGFPRETGAFASGNFVMKREYGAYGGATLEKSKLDLSQSTARVAPQLEDGGGGGNIGKKNNHGGGDGGDDGGDDDDYFGEDDGEDGDDGGFFGRRFAVPEIFDRKIVEAVLQEWYKTMSDLPAGIRQAVEMGLISSGQMVRFLSINARPTLSRVVARSMPTSVSRAFMGRLIADPSFMYKFAIEQATVLGFGVWWEVNHRRERLKREWHIAAANILSMSLCNAAIVWTLAPSRSYGSIFKYDWQNTLQKLPNNVFDKSYPLREFDLQKRAISFFYKGAEVGLVGAVIGAAGAGIGRVPPAGDNQSLVSLPSISRSALSYSAFLGLSGNLRYQLVYGAERMMQQNVNSMGLLVLLSSALRILNIHLGESSRLSLLGINEEMVAYETEGLTKAYHRPSLSPDAVARWIIPKRGVISGFFEEMFHQTKDSRQSQSSNIFSKRKVKRKVTVGR